MPDRAARAAATGLVAGVLSAAILLSALGSTQGLPGSLLASLGFFVAFAIVAHVGIVGLFVRALVSPFRDARGVALSFGLAHATLGGLYGLLTLSAIKRRVTGSNLELADLRFLVASFRQILGEGTAAERRELAGAALLLPLAAILFALASRFLARRARPLGARELAAMALAGVGACGILASLDSRVRVLAVSRFPDAAWIAGTLEPAGAHRVDPLAWNRDPARQSPRAPYVGSAGFRRWNVLVIMLESASWERTLGAQARLESIPNLAGLASRSAVFERAYATSTHSDYAQTSILASLEPRKFVGHDYFVDLEYPRTLPWDLLGPLGYRSAIFSCQNENWGNMRSFLKTPALDLLRHAPDWPEAPRRGDAVSPQSFRNPLDVAFRGAALETKVFEETVVSGFLEWIDEQPESPFVAYLNFQATHFPYVAAPGFEGPYQPSQLDFPATFFRYPAEKVPIMLNRWHNALAYSDRELGRLLRGLAERGLEERTAIVVVSDHGEAFHEAGFQTHGTSLRQEQLGSVLLLRAPGVAPRRISEPVSLLDALPSLLHEMGLPRHGNWQGRDDVLAPGYSGADRPIFATIQGLTREDSVVRGDRQLIVNWARNETRLFDLTALAGPDLVAREPGAVWELRNLLIGRLDEQLSYYAARAWRLGFYPPRVP